MKNLEFQNIIQNAGLSESEAKIYLAGLELGPVGVQQIARKTLLSRMACYSLMKSLVDRGLASWYQKGKKRYFSVESPDRLVTDLEEKISQTRNALPQLRGIYKLSGKRPTVSFYEGVAGLKAVIDDTLNAPREFLVFSSQEDVDKLIDDPEYWRRYVQKRVKLGIKARGICPRSKAARRLSRTNKKELREIRYLSKGKTLGPTEIYIYGDKVALLSYRGEIVGVVIESKEIAEAQRKIFEMTWQQCSEK